MSTLRVAQELVAVLDEIRASGFADEGLIQRAKTLNMRLAPVYLQIYGGVPLITTEHPSWIWWPRAREKASQALAALDGGLVSETDERDRAAAPGGAGEIRSAGARLRGLGQYVDDLLANPLARYFDPSQVIDVFTRYEAMIEVLREKRPDLFDDLPERGVPEPGGTTENEGRGYIHRDQLEAIRRDINYCLTVLDESTYDGAVATIEVGREGVFFAGAEFDALRLVHKIIETAESSIVVVDGYLDESVLELLSAKKAGVDARVLTHQAPQSLGPLVTAFDRQHGNLEVRRSTAFHDRFLGIDGTDFFHFGASIKDVGRRGFMFSKIEEESVVGSLRDRIEEEWAKATPIT